jgi:hypothetical protein
MHTLKRNERLTDAYADILIWVGCYLKFRHCPYQKPHNQEMHASCGVTLRAWLRYFRNRVISSVIAAVHTASSAFGRHASPK